MAIKIKLPQQGISRDKLGEARWGGDPTDGDTPTVALNIRLINVDAPEVHYPGTTKPSKHDKILSNLLQTHGGVFPPVLRDFLSPRLKGKPGTNQELLGEQARAAFKEMADKLLEFDPVKKRYGRKVFLMTGQDPFDRYKRLLAYVGPDEKNSKKRMTFNLLLARDGWVVNYLIFPNIPKRKDLELLQAAVHTARTEKKGIWAQEVTLLLGYEFRYAVDTARGTAQGPRRYCADISTAELFQPGDYFRVLPENRLFIDNEDVEEARTTLGLKWV